MQEFVHNVLLLQILTVILIQHNQMDVNKIII